MKRILSLLVVLLILLSLTLTGCKSDAATLYVYNWGEYIDHDLLDKFTKETGIKVIYDTYDTNEMMLAKLEAGAANYDVIFPSDYIIEELIRKNMLQEIDFSNVPNFKNIDPRFKNLPYDPENKYSVPYFWGTLGIMYNSDAVKETVDSWHILWDEKYAGKILMLDSIRDSIGIALKKLGYSLNTKTKEQIEEAGKILIEQKPLVNGYYVDEIKDMMINGDAVLALNWSGAAMDIYWEGIENINYIVPKEGSNLWFDCMVIPKTAKNKDAAEKFINFLLDPDNAYQNTEFVGYSTPNMEVVKRMKEENSEIIEMPAYWPSDEILERCEVFVDLGEALTIYNEVWTRVQAQ